MSGWVGGCVRVCVGEYTSFIFIAPPPPPSFPFNCNKAANTGHKRYASSPSSSKDVKKPTNTWTDTQ